MSYKVFTVADVKYLDGPTLKSWILQGHTNLGSNFQIIDVRDGDYIGGHIVCSKHIESNSFKNEKSIQTLSLLLNTLRQKKQDTVVFHCMLSQQRGPSSAMRFMRYLNEKLELSQDQQELEFVQSVKIYILRGGFGKWQEVYGEDPKLTEGYRKDIWKYGY
jgi:Cdc25 family phosphatase